MTTGTSQFRQVMSAFATGVTIVTSGKDGRYHGMTANAFASVSLEPELVLICVDRAADTHPFIEESGFFNVSILAEDQQDLARVFADERMQERHDLRDVPCSLGRNGVPVLEGALAHLECRVTDRYQAGDHTVFIGMVEHSEMGEKAQPLLFYRRRYATLEP